MWLSQSVLLVNVVTWNPQYGVLTEKLGLSEFFFHTALCTPAQLVEVAILNEVSSEVSFVIASKGEEEVELMGLEHIWPLSSPAGRIFMYPIK